MRTSASIVKVLACAWLLSLPAWGQATDGDDPTFADLRQQVTDALTNDDRERALEALERAESATERAATARAAAEQYESLAEAAPDQLAALREELADPTGPEREDLPSDATLLQIEQTLTQASADLRAKRESLRLLELEIAERRQRMSEIPEEIAEATQALSSLRDMPEPAGDGLLPTVRSLARQAEIDAIEEEIGALRAEQTSGDAREALLLAKRDRAERRVVAAETREERLRETVREVRQREAGRAAREAEELRRSLASESEVLAAYAAVTESLAEQRASPDGVPQQITEAEVGLAATRQQLAELRTQYSTAVRRLTAYGFNRATGIVLRRQYESLPETTTLRRALAQTRSRLEAAELKLVERQELRVPAGGVDRIVRSLKSAAAEQGEDIRDPAFEGLARQLAEARRNLIEQLIADATAYLDELLALEREQATLLSTSRAYREFIGERILWVKSITRETSDRRLLDAGAPDDLPSIETIGSIVPELWAGVRADPLRPVLWLAAICIAVGSAWWASGMLARTAESVRRYRTDRLRLTYGAMLLTLLVAAPWVIVWLAAGALVGIAPNPTEFGVALGWAMQRMLPVVAAVSVVAACVRRDGLADAHFRWPSRAVDALRRHLRWSGPAFLLLLLVALTIDHTHHAGLNATFGRGAFILSQAVAAVYAWLILRPAGPVFSEYRTRRAGPTMRRVVGVAWVAGVGIPIALAIVSGLGYHYTALELSQRLAQSVGLLLLLVFGNAVLMRWLFVARRRVAVEDARRRRAQALSEAADEPGESDAPTESSLPPLDEDKLDLPAISGQTTQLFRVGMIVALALGLLGIWSSVLPALRALDRVQLWPSIRVVEPDVDPRILALADGFSPASAVSEPDAPASTADGAEPVTVEGFPGLSYGSAVPQDDPPSAVASVITLADVGLAIVIAVVGIAAFRNVPGLAEIFVLQRLPLDAASRFALATVLRYAIGFAAVFATAGTLGIAWDRVQWLAAALTFGLGFGLQEIFANFVSGLIMLAERPVRIGDTVTVGNVSGVVSKIRMRATTITDWDRKELVIPNRQFITGEVINWTLSDQTLRVTVKVGVAYGTDVALVERVLMQIAAENPTVMAEPKHYVLFTDFGDSTLNFELRVFIPSIDHVLVVPHQLRVAIDKAFREHGIEIAFPQRDLHIRSADPLLELAERTRSGGSGIERT